MKTLLISPHPKTQQLLGRVLRQRNHELNVVKHDDEACAALRSENYSLVILDVGGPNGANVGLCRRLRALLQGRQSVFLAADRSREPRHLEALLAAGADDYLAGLEDTQRLAIRLAVAEHRARAGDGHLWAERPLERLPIKRHPLLYDAPFGVFQTTVEGKFVEVNRAMMRMLGYDSEDEMLQLDLAQEVYVAPAVRARLVARPSGYLHAVQLDLKRKDCTLITVRSFMRTLRDESGRVIGFEGVAEDITERREAERAVRESEARLRNLLDNMPDVVMMVDCDGIIQYINHAAGNRTPADILGKDVLDSIHPDYRKTCWDALQRAIRTRTVQHAELLHVTDTWWVGKIVPMVEDREVGNVMVITSDVTEHKKAEERVQKEQQLLRQLLDLHERDRRLIAYEIHDGFAQQLTGAWFNLEAFAGMHDRDPEAAWKLFHAGLQLVSKSIDESRRLISGLRPPILDELGIVAAVDYLVCESREHGGPTIEFRHDVQFDRLAPPLESAIFRITQESLNNACHHSQSDKINIELVQRGDSICLSVRDWGIGFDPANVQEQRFGLQGIRERARLIGGHVTIQAAPNQGTEITVELPLIKAPREQHRP